MHKPLLPSRLAAILTDFYQLTMMAGYVQHEKQNQRSVFEYFFRGLPRDTGFCIFAGLDDLLNDLSDMRFETQTLEYLKGLNVFSRQFLDYLHEFEFTCDIWAAREGTPVFPNEPILRVDGPIAQAQLVETLVLNRLNYQTLIATKAARVCYAAEGDPVLDFGLRRAQGPDGGVSGSRAAYIGGCSATSNLLAGFQYGIPVRGTMAHAWVLSFGDEKQAFNAFMEVFPENPVLLVDTYDTETSGIPNAISTFTNWRDKGWTGKAGIRLDSGDLAFLSKHARKLLDKAGFEDAWIVASNSLNEDLIADLKRQGAKINSWGVGTDLITGSPEPALAGIYKLVALEENGEMKAKMKISSNSSKTTDPGIKTPVRFTDDEGFIAGDTLVGVEEAVPDLDEVISCDRVETARVKVFAAKMKRESLLHKVMDGGARLSVECDVDAIRQYAQKQLDTLHPELRRLRNPERFWVGLSEKLAETKAKEVRRLTSGGPAR